MARITGHSRQGRYGSVVMDEMHLVHEARRASLNPVHGRLVKGALDWAWTSKRAHLAGPDDEVVKVGPILERVGEFAEFLDELYRYRMLGEVQQTQPPRWSVIRDVLHRVD